jgi:uncharacterized protein (DUF58 family)
MNPRIKLRQPHIAWIIIVLLGLQINEASRVYTILLVTFGGIFLISYFWSRSLGREIQLRRETRLTWVQVGGHIEERLTLSNTSLFPAAYVQFIDHSTMPEFHAGKITSISAGGIDQWTVSAFCRQRGMFALGDAHMISGDPFGIFEVTIHASERTSILVLPQPATIPEYNIAPSGVLGEGPPRRNSPQQTMHASTVREFAEGDSTRLIHWPTTARTSKTFVRLMESAPEGDWSILLDLDQRCMRGAGWDSIEEQSVSLAASLTELGLHARKSVGMVANGRELAWIRPQKGDGQKWEILQALAVASPGPLTLAAMFDKMQVALGKHHSLLIITACTEVGWIKSLPSLVKRGVIPTVLLMDPTSFDENESIEKVVSMLGQQGIRHYIIPHGLIEPPQIDPAPSDKWTWRATPGGQFIPIRSS